MTLQRLGFWFSLLLFFCILMVIYDVTAQNFPWNGDDWSYLSRPRSMRPILGDWNPARVLPEVFLPLLGLVAGYLVTPLTGSYPDAVQLTASITSAFLVCLLCVAVERFLRLVYTKFVSGHSSAFAASSAISSWLSLFGMLLFMALSLVLFKSGVNKENDFLFITTATNVFAFYLIPNILNSLLVLGFLAIQLGAFPNLNKHWPAWGAIFLVIYLAQFSITFAALISSVCAGLLIVVRIAFVPQEGLWQKLCAWLQKRDPFDLALLFCVFCFLIAALFDMNGGRFASVRVPSPNFGLALAHFHSLALQIRSNFLLLAVFSCFGALFTALYRLKSGNSAEKKQAKTFCLLWGIIVAASILWFCATISISAMSMLDLARRIPFMFGLFFYLILLTVICVTYLLRAFPWLWLCAPVLLCYLGIEIGRADRPWRIYHTKAQKEIVYAWMNEVQKQDKAGKQEAVIIVPKAEWPHPREWFGDVFSHTLFAHGQTSRRLKITLKEADKEAEKE